MGAGLASTMVVAAAAAAVPLFGVTVALVVGIAVARGVVLGSSFVDGFRRPGVTLLMLLPPPPPPVPLWLSREDAAVGEEGPGGGEDDGARGTKLFFAAGDGAGAITPSRCALEATTILLTQAMQNC